MRVRKISVENFGPFGQFDAEFSSGLNVITGPNWSGKSEALSALAWCVSGRTTRYDGRTRREDGIIRVGAGLVRVRVVLDSGITIDRSRVRGKATVVRVTGVGPDALEGVAAQAAIWEAIGIGADGYASIAYVSQGRVTALADVGDRERRDVLLSWLGDAIEVWDTGRRGVVVERRDTKRVLDTKRAELAAVASISAETKTRLAGFSVSDASDIDAVSKRYHFLRRELESGLAATERRARLASDISGLEQEIAGIESEIERLDTTDITVPDVPDDSSARDAAAGARARLQQFDAAMSADWSGRCPLTTETCPCPGTVQAAREPMQLAKSRLDTDLIRYNEVIESSRAARLEKREAESRRARIQARSESCTEQLAKSRHQLDRLRVEYSGLAAPGDDQAVRAELLDLERVINNHRDWMVAKTEIERLDTKASGLRDEIGELEARYRVLGDVVRACDEVSGPAVLARTRIEQRVAELLQGSGISVELSWTTETKQRVTDCSECGESTVTNRKTCRGCGIERALATVPDLGIITEVNGIKRDIRYGSGGLRQLVCLAIRIATCPVGHIVLDEADSALDRNSRTIAAQLLRRAAVLGTQVIVVTHGDEIADTTDTLFEVVPASSDSPARLEKVQ